MRLVLASTSEPPKGTERTTLERPTHRRSRDRRGGVARRTVSPRHAPHAACHRWKEHEGTSCSWTPKKKVDPHPTCIGNIWKPLFTSWGPALLVQDSALLAICSLSWFRFPSRAARISWCSFFISCSWRNGSPFSVPQSSWIEGRGRCGRGTHHASNKKGKIRLLILSLSPSSMGSLAPVVAGQARLQDSQEPQLPSRHVSNHKCNVSLQRWSSMTGTSCHLLKACCKANLFSRPTRSCQGPLQKPNGRPVLWGIVASPAACEGSHAPPPLSV